MANHWQESQIDVSNFEAWLAASPLGSARHNANSGANAFGAFATQSAVSPQPDHDMGTFRDFEVDCSFLQPPELFISLPIPKDFRAPVYAATPHHSHHQHHFLSPMDVPQFGQASIVPPINENTNPDMLLLPFMSPKVMTFSQGFGLEPSTPSNGLKKEFPFGLIPSGVVENMNASPMFGTTSKLDMDYGQEEDFESKSQLVMLHQAPQLGHYNSMPSMSTSFALNAAEEMSTGDEENISTNVGRLHRAHSEDSCGTSSTVTASAAPARISEIASSCHHCKRRRHPNELKPCHRNGAKVDRNGTEAVASRRTCRKRYCLGCLQKYGITFAEAELPGWTCMACRGLCECAACRRKGN